MGVGVGVKEAGGFQVLSVHASSRTCTISMCSPIWKTSFHSSAVFIPNPGFLLILERPQGGGGGGGLPH